MMYGAGWTGMVAIAILNGAMREKRYGRRLEELAAHQLSTVIGMILLGVYIWVSSTFLPIRSGEQALTIRGAWLLMTVIFDFGLGHHGWRHPRPKLPQDYNLLRGRVWLLLLFWTAAAPHVAYRIRS